MATPRSNPSGPRDEDDVGDQPVFIVRPAENVYSFFMFIGPTESKRFKRQGTNWDIVMAYILVAMNFVFQGVLLYMIFHEVVVSNFEWQQGIMKLEGKGVMGLFTEEMGKCNDGGALCFKDGGGNLTCAPPSIQLTGRWNELDTDGDGVWTRKEVMAARADLKCKYVVDPVEVFDVMINMLKLREKLIWIHPDIHSGHAIALPYFTYAMGDLVMCGYRSQDMCSNLVKSGFFDAPMKHGTAPRVGTTIESALKYCNALLAEGGTCETLLPSTYAVWKIQSQAECGSPGYSKFTYTNPGNGVQKSLLSVDYSAREEYELAQEPGFRIFKGIMVYMWLLLMVYELREVYKMLTLCARFPGADEFGEDAVLVEQDPSDPEDIRFRIQGITSAHRTQMSLLCVARVAVTGVLAAVGCSYLFKTNGYADLIMNGVALVFIAEISSVLYSQILREEIKDQTGDIKPIRVRMYGVDYLNRRPALLDLIFVMLIFVAVGFMMFENQRSVVVPVHEALECTCISSGEKCVEAQQFNSNWWNHYWKTAVPAVYGEINALKAKSAALLQQEDTLLEARMKKLESVNENLQAELGSLENPSSVPHSPKLTAQPLLLQVHRHDGDERLQPGAQHVH